MEKYEPQRKGDKIFNMVVISCVEVNLGKIARLCGIEKKITGTGKDPAENTTTNYPKKEWRNEEIKDGVFLKSNS